MRRGAVKESLLGLQVDEIARLGRELADGDAAAAHDEVGRGGHLLARDVDELTPVVHDPSDPPLLLQALHPADGILHVITACIKVRLVRLKAVVMTCSAIMEVLAKGP